MTIGQELLFVPDVMQTEGFVENRVNLQVPTLGAMLHVVF